jgi:cytoskeleton protein RodZ
MSEAAPTEARDPGAMLAAARERSGLSLMQVAERLRLDIATLQALEAGRFQSLGAAVFVRGHLRRYGELLGLNVAAIEAAYAGSSAALAPLPDLRQGTAPLTTARQDAAVPARTALIGAIAVVLLASVWWAMRVPKREHGPSSAATPSAAAISPAVAPTSSPTIAATPPVRLGLKFSQDSWAEIYDADGSTLLHELAPAGSEQRLAGRAPLRILLGNPEGVALELDGRPVALDASADPGSARRFSLDGGGRVIDVGATTGAATTGAATAGAAPAAARAVPAARRP